MKKFILIINGPICSGKTTVAELLSDRLPNTFRVAGDKIKWLISDYSADRHREAVGQLSFALARQALTLGFSLIVDGGSHNTGAYIDLARERGLKVVEVSLEASLHILTERFKERVKRAKLAGNKISCATEEKMMEIYNRYLEVKNTAAATFDTGRLTAAEICAKILEIIK